jgi:hypothetical protein
VTSTTAGYTFFAWIRGGVAAELSASGAGTAAVTLGLAQDGVARDLPPRSVRFYGPGDVLGIDPRQVIRTEPRPLATDFPPNRVVAIEFDEEKLPWAFTVEATPGDDRLRPWVWLLVLRRDPEALDLAARPLPVLTLPNADELPDLGESWAWAHAQVARGANSPASVDDYPPAQTLSRLLSPRILEAGKAYYACVVPTFRAGVEAGLNEDVKADPREVWNPPPTGDVRLPVYYHWEFSTGPEGDFKTLARRLQAGSTFPPEVGVRSMNMSAAGGGLPSGLPPLALDGALRPIDPAYPPDGGWPPVTWTEVRAKLRQLREPAGSRELVVTLPTYGSAHASGSPPPPWLDDLNLDPRNRAAAGLGTRVVQEQQEQLAASAWDQAREVARANQLLAEAQLSLAVEQSVYEKRLQPLPPEVVVQVTEPVHARVPTEAGTVRTDVEATVFPTAAASPPLRRVLRPGGPLGRRLQEPSEAAAPTDLVTALASGDVKVVLKDPAGMATVDAVSDDVDTDAIVYANSRPQDFDTIPGWKLVRDFRGTRQSEPLATASAGARARRPIYRDGTSPDDGLDGRELDSEEEELRERLKWIRARFRAASRKHLEHLGLSAASPGLRAPPQAALDLGDLKSALLGDPALDREGKLDPARTVPERVAAQVPRVGPIVANGGGDPLRPILARPRFPQPMYEPLRAISQELLLPGLEHVPPDSIGLLEGNAAFIEAYMVGLNHELERELLWRGYPIAPGSTYFTRFWDLRGRIEDGRPLPPSEMGEIATWNQRLGENTKGVGGSSVLVLVARGELIRRHPTLILYAAKAAGPRSLATPEVHLHPAFRGQLDPDVLFAAFPMTVAEAAGSAANAGWFFVIQEQPTEPAFGVDEPSSEKFLDASALGETAADVARALLQDPFRLAVHARELLALTAPILERRVTWAQRPRSAGMSGRITAIGGATSSGRPWRLTLEEAIAAIESGTQSLYVKQGDEPKASLVVGRRLGRKHLKTTRDTLFGNNLLKLPRWP